MMAFRAGLVLAAAALPLLACAAPAEFSAPISQSGTVEHDRRLVGAWYALVEDKVSMQLNIGASDDGLLNAVAIVAVVRPDESRDAGDTVAWLAATAWPSEIDGQLYYNIRRKEDFGSYKLEDDLGKPGYIVARAEFPDDDTLRLTAISSRWITGLIRGGRLPGQEGAGKWGTYGSYSRADIGGAELRALIRSHKAGQMFQAFPIIGLDDTADFVFKRLKPTYQRQ